MPLSWSLPSLLPAKKIDRRQTTLQGPTTRTLDFGHKGLKDAAGHQSLFRIDGLGRTIWRDTNTALSPDQWHCMGFSQRMDIILRVPFAQRGEFLAHMATGKASRASRPAPAARPANEPAATPAVQKPATAARKPFLQRLNWFASQYRSTSNPNEDQLRRNANCGPACVTMAARAFGKLNIQASQVDAAIEQTRRRTGDSNDQTDATTPGGLARAARSYGLGARVIDGISLNTVKAELAEGHLPIVLLRPSYLWPGVKSGHYTVVTAVKGGKVYLNDPANPSGPMSISVRQFNRSLAQRGAYRMVSVAPTRA